VLNAIFYRLRTGCQWRYLPKDFPNWSTVATCVRTWRRDGRLQQVHDALRDQVHQQAGKAPEPTAAIIGAADACPLGGVKIQPNRNKRAHIPS